MTWNRRNWAENYSYGAARLYHPAAREQVQELVARSVKLRALGTRQSFTWQHAYEP